MNYFYLFSPKNRTVFSWRIAFGFCAIFVVLFGSAHKTEDKTEG